ncbi:MAG TPA: extensin family protein [Bauldia sp.]|nr:extensin family protein [Bauldia sp.]
MAARKPSSTIAEIGPIVEEGTCGMDFPLEVTALSSGTVAMSPVAKMGCPLADALEAWLADAVQPAAMAEFGSQVVEVRQISAYACRNRNNFGKELSEHAFGNALDVSGFKLANGKVISVQHGWKGDAKEQAFLKTVFAGACAQFTTSLGPGSNIMHYNHFHVDLAKLAPDGSPKMCKAGGVASPTAPAGEGTAAAAEAPDASAPVPGGGTAVPGAD